VSVRVRVLPPREVLVTVDRLREGPRGWPTEAVPIVRLGGEGAGARWRLTRRRLVERVPACPVERPE
jgi:hypothetical protein